MLALRLFWILLGRSSCWTFSRWSGDENSGACKISFLELAVYVATEGKKWVPMPHLHRAGCWQDRDAFNFSEPNLGALVRLVKAFFHSLGQCFSLDICWCKGINLSFLGVCTPQDGLTLAISVDDANLSMDHLKSFTWRRPIRRANDLARPLRVWASSFSQLPLQLPWHCEQTESPRVMMGKNICG